MNAITELLITMVTLTMEVITFSVNGLLGSLDYHKANYVAQILVETYPQQFNVTSSERLMEFQWNIRKEEIKQTTSNKLVAEEITDAAIFSNNGSELKWTTDSLVKWVEENSLLPDLQESLNKVNFHEMASQAYVNHTSNNSKLEFVYMRICVEDGKQLGKLTFQLFRDLCPKTVNNFVSLCTGDRGESEEGIRLSYKGSTIHRIIPNGWIQGGDICGGSGSGGTSIYGQTFPDESFAVSHNVPGIIGMVNSGRNTNGSQFYITLKQSQWMDGQYVAFGRVVEGTDVLKQIESLSTYNERPMVSCYVSECGLLTQQ